MDAKERVLHTWHVSTRREKFREYMVRFSPAADPVLAIRSGLYVPRPGRSMADEIAGRIDLDPSSSHLVVGGIGSGKTTQLLITCDQLNKLPDVHADYIDVSLRHDITRLDAGVLTTLAGTALGVALEDTEDKKALEAIQQFRKWEQGYTEKYYDEDQWHPNDDDDEDYGHDEPSYSLIEHPPRLVPPVDLPMDPTVDQAGSLLKVLHDDFLRRAKHPVLLLDSLDRLSDIDAFAVVVEQDLRAIKRAGVGIVLAGPLRTMYGRHRSLVDHFTRFYPQPAVDVRTDPEGLDFMIRVLRRRASAEVLPDASCKLLAELSGGVLRDLMALSLAAGEEAYVVGADCIDAEHVRTVADAFGRKLFFGLRSDEVTMLERARREGTFVPKTDDELALLVTRRVLEYGNGGNHYRVHPTLEPLLEQMKESA